jgi:DNA-binding NarL/FixJ family response regulator
MDRDPPVICANILSVRLLVIDDHLAFAQAISVVVEAEDDLEVVAQITTPLAAEDATGRLEPDVALIDVELGDDDGIDLAARLITRRPSLQVLMVSCHHDARTICSAIRAGASGFVTKECAAEDLVNAIRALERKETWIPPRLLGSVLREFQRSATEPRVEETRFARLSRREREVLALMVCGLDYAGIARELYLSANTVRTHAHNVLSKLDVHSSLEAVSVAMRAGIRPSGGS